MSEKIRVGVLFGGQSGEHEVSIVSARAVLGALDREKYEVLPIGITKDGRWIAGEQAPAQIESLADAALLPGGPQAAPSAAPTSALAASTSSLGFLLESSQAPLDVVFPVLHGPRGEDGTVQGLFELAGIPYVGCGVLASSVGMDKAMMKAAFAAAGLAQVPWAFVRRVDWQAAPEATLDTLESQLRYPMFVKPANMGSSVGISKAKTREELAEGLRLAASYDRRIVVEQGLNVRELEISVLGNDTPEASVPGEVVSSKEWYDYEAKYLAGESQILIPAPITPAQMEEIKSLAVLAFKAIDGAGLARVDFLMDKDTGALYINEVNTMPGFTPLSMYAKMWEASGLSYSALLDRLIELALERHPKA
ncbi:D-alanine--D-alanine ligase [Chloroflexia bacterium SDU3-3]|nr:D-alanine--D-alanine ligase [Chloroflexia bacterium SDU3-3]